jgi:hypothetical protein
VVTDYMLDTRGSGIDVIRHARSQYGDELPCLIITGDPINAGGMSLPAGVKLAFKPVHYSSMLSILTSLLPAPADPA